jgi:hypothetical protein
VYWNVLLNIQTRPIRRSTPEPREAFCHHLLEYCSTIYPGLLKPPQLLTQAKLDELLISPLTKRGHAGYRHNGRVRPSVAVLRSLIDSVSGAVPLSTHLSSAVIHLSRWSSEVMRRLHVGIRAGRRKCFARAQLDGDSALGAIRQHDRPAEARSNGSRLCAN